MSNQENNYLIFQGEEPMFPKILSTKDKQEKAISYLERIDPERYKNLSARIFTPIM